MAATAVEMKPKSMKRPKRWSDEVEENYRFQLAGYRDRYDYSSQRGDSGVSSQVFVSKPRL